MTELVGNYRCCHSAAGGDYCDGAAGDAEMRNGDGDDERMMYDFLI